MNKQVPNRRSSAHRANGSAFYAYIQKIYNLKSEIKIVVKGFH